MIFFFISILIITILVGAIVTPSNQFRLLLLLLNLILFLSSDLLPHVPQSFAFEQSLVSAVGHATDLPESLLCLNLGTTKCLTDGFRRLRLQVLTAIAQNSQPVPVPLEDLGSVFLFDVTRLDTILLEKLVKCLISATTPSDMHQLIVIPMFRQHRLRPCSFSPELINDAVSTVFADKAPEENDCVRALRYLTVQTPFIVRILQEVL